MKKLRPFLYSTILMICGIILLIYINSSAIPQLKAESIRIAAEIAKHDTVRICDTVCLRKTDSLITSVYFNTGNVFLEREQEQKLFKAINRLGRTEGKVFILNGYADRSGSSSYNDKVSSDRSFYVFRMLIQKGIKKENIFMRSFGSIDGCKSVSDSVRKVDVSLMQDIWR